MAESTRTFDSDGDEQPTLPKAEYGRERWLLTVDPTDIVPNFLVSPQPTEEVTEHGWGPLEEMLTAPFRCEGLSGFEAESQALSALKWTARLERAVRANVSLHRSNDNTVLMVFELLDQAQEGLAGLQVVPELNFLREEWNCRCGTAGNVEELNGEFSERLLDELPFAAVLPPLPHNLRLGDVTKTTKWIEKELIRRNLPLSDTSDYATTEVSCYGPETPALLVKYTPRKDPLMLQEWITWVAQNVPGAFSVPLRSTVTPPDRSASQIVAMALEDLQAPDALAEIELDSTEAEERLRTKLPIWGTEALGWYQPYHVYDPEHWGIYLHSASILDLGITLRDRLATVGCLRPLAGFEIAVRLILEHEFFHARLEAFALGQEVSDTRPVFNPYDAAVYRPTLGTPQALEEAAANYVARRKVNELAASQISAGGWSQAAVDAVMAYVDELYALSPPGYSHWHLAGYPRTWRLLAAQTITGSVQPQEPLAPVEPFLESLPLGVVEIGQIPIWMTMEHSVPDRLFSVPTRREVVRVLKNRGYEPRPGKGSHEVWQAPDGGHFTLPSPRTLTRRVFQNLLHHWGISKEQYLAIRGTL